MCRLVLAGWLVLAALGSPFAAAVEPVPEELPGDFASDVVPFLQIHCNGCHSLSDPEAGLALEAFEESGNVQQNYELWEKVIRFVEDRQMPPADEAQPSEEEIAAFVRGVRAELATFDCSSEPHPGRVTIRRLNRAEYNNTIRDLVGINFQPADDFPADDVGNGFDNIGDVLTLPPVLLEKYLTAAEQVSDRVFENPETLRRIVIHEEGDGVDAVEAARRNIRAFASRAFRRPATDEEVARLMELMRFAWQQDTPREEILKTALQAILISPHFLFRVERDPLADDVDGIRRLDDYEIASRLSYFLWSSMPDQELFDLAADGKLQQAETLQQQVRRMLQDPKSEALVENFAGQWLQLRDLQRLSPDPVLFPAFDDALRRAMYQETALLFQHVMCENRSVLEFLTADYSFVNDRLARHYGIEGVEGNRFQRVALDGRRRGVLTHASILLITSNPTRTSPVKRGKWILDNILGTPPPPPPPGVPELEEEGVALGSLREQMEQHRSNEACAVCHRDMDTLGFGLENFDVIGGWRTKDGRFPIDPAGELPGGLDFETPAELMQLLAAEKAEEFCRAFTKKMMTYALGRGLATWDRCAVDAVLQQASEEDYRFEAVVTGIVLSDPFLMREGPEE